MVTEQVRVYHLVQPPKAVPDGILHRCFLLLLPCCTLCCVAFWGGLLGACPAAAVHEAGDAEAQLPALPELGAVAGGCPCCPAVGLKQQTGSADEASAQGTHRMRCAHGSERQA